MNRDSLIQPPLISPKLRFFPAREIAITSIYLLLASAWIIASDQWLEHWRGHSDRSASLQTVKGLNFVLVTSLLLYVVLRRAHSRRRLAEASCSELSERFELVARASNDAIWDWNLVTNTLWRSDGYTKLFGWDEETQPTLDSWVKNLHPDERDNVVRSLHRPINSGESSWADEYRFRRKNGTYAVVHDRGFVIHDLFGRPVRMVGGITDVSEQKEAEERLRETQAQLRALTSRIESLREDERFRISREIHDELGQVLTGVKMNLTSIENRIAKLDGSKAFNPILERVVEANELVEESMKAVQRIASDLRPQVLDSLGLVSALKDEAERFSQRTGIIHSLHVGHDSSQVPMDISIAAFRIFQEALTNVARHAKASRIEIDIDVADDQIQLEICDNGRGIEGRSLQDPHSIGLLGMKERALAHGGEVTIHRRVQGGTRVIVRLPCAAATNRCAPLL